MFGWERPKVMLWEIKKMRITGRFMFNGGFLWKREPRMMRICIIIVGRASGSVIMHTQNCRNPTLAKCGGEAQHLEKVRSWSPPGLPNVQSSTARPKTPRIGMFLVSLERYWSVDIENGLALAIWTSAAQVMGKRRAGSQTGSLTPDH